MKKEGIEVVMLLYPEQARMVLVMKLFRGITPMKLFPMDTVHTNEDHDKWLKKTEKWRAKCLKRAIPVEGVLQPRWTWLYKAYV